MLITIFVVGYVTEDSTGDILFPAHHPSNIGMFQYFGEHNRHFVTADDDVFAFGEHLFLLRFLTDTITHLVCQFFQQRKISHLIRLPTIANIVTGKQIGRAHV